MSWKCQECGSKSARLIKTCRRCKSTDIDLDTELVASVARNTTKTIGEIANEIEAKNENNHVNDNADAARLAEFVRDVALHHRREVVDVRNKTFGKAGALRDVPVGYVFRYGTVISQMPGMVTVQFADGERTTISPDSEVEHGPAVTQASKAVKELVNGVETDTFKLPTPRAKTSLLGFPVTAVFRWMGKQGWTAAEAIATAKKMGVECSDSTAKIQVRAGATGDMSRGEPADLTNAQVAELNAAKGGK